MIDKQAGSNFQGVMQFSRDRLWTRMNNNVCFQMLVKLRRRWKEKRMSSRRIRKRAVEHSKEQELESRNTCLSEILSLEGLEGRWRVTTADEWVEQVGYMVRRSEMEERLLVCSDL